jgi:hypothetical protein
MARARAFSVMAVVVFLTMLIVPKGVLANDARLTITKTADAASVAAPGQIGFTISVAIQPITWYDEGCPWFELVDGTWQLTDYSGTTPKDNTGDWQCPANNVVVTDTLPTTPPGLTWTIASADSADRPGSTTPCSISAGVLTCDWADMTLPFETKSVHITSTTTLPDAIGDGGTCGAVTNSAHVAYTWVDGTQQRADAGPAAVDVTCPTPPPTSPPSKGYFYFTKTVAGTLSGWTGGTFNFTVTCGTQVSIVTVTVPATGNTTSSTVFGPFTPGTTCSVTEGTVPSAGAGASWGTPTYAPLNSVAVLANTSTTIAVTNTRSTTPPSSPPTTPPSSPPTTPPSPSGSIAGATGTPSLPPTTSVPGGDSGAPGSSLLLFAAILGITSAGLVVTTGLRSRLLEHVDR